MKFSGHELLRLLVSIGICQFAGVIGSVFTYSMITTWYTTLNKPFFTPPNWVFGPAWVTLFTLMGISLYLVWREHPKKKIKKAVTIFGIQLALNSLWSIGFFGLTSPLLGLIIIVPLWIAILLSILEFRKVSVRAAWLLVPYILWTTFAAVLNLSVLLLN